MLHSTVCKNNAEQINTQNVKLRVLVLEAEDKVYKN